MPVAELHATKSDPFHSCPVVLIYQTPPNVYPCASACATRAFLRSTSYIPVMVEGAVVCKAAVQPAGNSLNLANLVSLDRHAQRTVFNSHRVYSVHHCVYTQPRKPGRIAAWCGVEAQRHHLAFSFCSLAFKPHNIMFLSELFNV